MATQLRDVWGDAINVDVLTPAAILNAQATLLKQKTQGIVIGEVTSTENDNGVVTLAFDLRAPAAGNMRATVLYVRHAKSFVYPALVTAAELVARDGRYEGNMQWGDEKDEMSLLAPTDDEFFKLLTKALRSPSVMSRIQSLIARSNEARQSRENGGQKSTSSGDRGPADT